MRILACFIRSALVVALAVCPGCYDGELLVREVRSTAVNTRLVEVDLGRFLTTLPRDRQNNTFAELDVHLFAAVPRSRVTAVKKQLKAEEYRLRHELLAAVRGATAEELAEPSLAGLRDRIERVVNGILNDSSVKSIGFYQLKLQRR